MAVRPLTLSACLCRCDSDQRESTTEAAHLVSWMPESITRAGQTRSHRLPRPAAA